MIIKCHKMSDLSKVSSAWLTLRCTSQTDGALQNIFASSELGKKSNI